MEVFGAVVYAQKFTSPKTGRVYTKLYVPIGSEVACVFANGDAESLAGVSNVRFKLVCKQGVLKLYYDVGEGV